MKNIQQGFIGIALIIILAIALGAGGTYYVTTKQKTDVQINTSTSTSTEQKINPSVQEETSVAIKAPNVSVAIKPDAQINTASVVVKAPQVIKKEIPQVSITVVDEAGKSFKTPDKVWWYYQPNAQGEATEHVIPCSNKECTTWNITGALGEKIYVAASYEPYKSPDAKCFKSGREIEPVNLSSNSTVQVQLVLKMVAYCY